MLRLDPGSSMRTLIADGGRVDDPPAVAATIDASLRALLTGERTALNLLQRLSGIATTTADYAEAVAGTGVELLDTRKTAPGLRTLDKYAVACGGGANHRSGLDDAVMIKDNHLLAAGSIAAAVGRVRAAHPGLPVEVEVDTVEQLREALAAGAETVLLDNMDVATLRRAVAETAGRARLEASGGITIDTIRDIAETGVDAISVGALTHSVRALDITLEVIPSPS
jgi:nicotinate-nucleotide pyrophosphorylase (carboxylating)